MTAAWIAYGLLVGALLGLTAAALDRACRLASRPARWVWGAALALTIGFVALAPQGARAVSDDAPSARDGSSVLRGFRHAMAIPGQYAMDLATRVVPPSFDKYLLAGWATLSAVLILTFASVYVRFRRQFHAWPIAELHGIRVRIAPDAGPLVAGLVRPQIALPQWLLFRSAEDQRVVLAHEREHVTAHDPLLLAAGCIAAALLPWHPGMWWMLGRLRLSVEVDCDARVLRRGMTPHKYGNLLIDIAERSSGLGVVGAPPLAMMSSHLKQRVLAMSPDVGRFAPARAGTLCAFAVIAFFAACDSELPTRDGLGYAPTDQEPGAGLISEPHIVIDGRRATWVILHALRPEQVADVEVLKGDAATRYIHTATGGVLLVTTTANSVVP